LVTITGVGSGSGSTPSNSGAFDPPAAAAERPLHQPMDVSLPGIDLLAKISHHATQFRDHGLGVTQLPVDVVDVVGRWHDGWNTATWSR